jgi:hypothetical protein
VAGWRAIFKPLSAELMHVFLPAGQAIVAAQNKEFVMLSPVGVIGLECLMSRANILFTSGYRFRGELDLKNLETSFNAIVSCIEKFEHRMHFTAQDDFHWQHAGASKNRFHMLESDDAEEEFRQLCRDSLALVDDGRHCPMALTVILDKSKRSEFILAQTSEHTYLDARSSEIIFNRIIEHYNALTRGDVAGLEAIVASAARIKTIGSSEMLKLLTAGDYDQDRNIEGLTAYPVADVGEYAIPLSAVPDCLENYKKQRVAPIIQFFDIKELLGHCRIRYPEVTQNSVICAALAKGFYKLNLSEKNKPDDHLISFKMLSDILTPELRQEYSGNYIAFVPVSVDAGKPIDEMAKQIHERIRHFKTTQLDVTIFKLTEQAVEQALVGLADDPLSFVVTNWNNYSFLNNEQYLHGCQSLRHQSGVNIEPKDTLGAILVNRPILVINMSSSDELCLSFFPSLRSDEENLQLAEQIGNVFQQNRKNLN